MSDDIIRGHYTLVNNKIQIPTNPSPINSAFLSINHFYSPMVAFIDYFLTFMTVPWAWPTDISDVWTKLNPLIAFNESQACVYPNSCWPASHAWNSLNDTLGGSLFRARPPAYVCHEPFVNETACDIARTNWMRFAFILRGCQWRTRSCNDWLVWFSQLWRAEQPGGYFDTGEAAARFFPFQIKLEHILTFWW